jgi:diguanylate cyclase (GGDEF)-like protein
MDNNLRILIIDDNPEIHRDFIKVLTTNRSNRSELEGFEKALFGTDGAEKSALPEFHIDTASQGQEGLERIKKAIEENRPYALAFVDIRMPPGWDGIETIKHVWEVDPDIQIVICTAYSDYSWEETVAELGQRENLLILKKPFDHIAVRQLSCALTRKWQLLKESHEYTESLEENVKERTHLLQQSLSVTRGTLESAADGIVVIDNENHIIDFNQKLLDLWRIPPIVIEHKDGEALLESIVTEVEDSEGFSKITREAFLKKGPMKIIKLKTKDNRTLECYSQPYKLNEKVAGQVWSFRDITERAMLEEQVQHQATYDMLTGLPNRALLVDRVHQAITLAKRDDTKFGVLFFDLDRFKLINDSFSHSTGDELLQQVAQRIIFATRESDTIARLGGDEFIGILISISNDDALKIIADKLLDVFKQPFKISDCEVTVSASVGVSVFPRDGATVDELLRNADIAMYRAKEMGGNQLQFYSPIFNTHNIEHLELETALHKALEKKELFLCYQPQIDVKTNEMFSVEALIRWQHPKRGLMLPIDFIPIAEQTGFIISIGAWVLKEACQQNKRWQDAGLRPIRVTVNVATKQFKQPNFVEIVENVLKETGLKPEYLELELTENLLIKTADAQDTLAKLNKLGISIALDDFGTGYSSLGYLRHMHIDRLKIDQSYVKNIDRDDDDEIIIKAIIAMAHSLKLDVVAEGVETQKQLDFLKRKHCGEAQGYFFSEPLPAKEVEAMLKSQIESE